MKRILLLLLFPFVASAFFKDVHVKDTKVCNKLKSEYSSFESEWIKSNNRWVKAFGDLKKVNTYPQNPKVAYSVFIDSLVKATNSLSVSSASLSKYSSKMSKVYSNGLKHKCFKQAKACIAPVRQIKHSLSGLSKAYTIMTKAYSDLVKNKDKVSGGNAVLVKARGNLKKSNSTLSKDSNAWFKATEGIKKHCTKAHRV